MTSEEWREAGVSPGDYVDVEFKVKDKKIHEPNIKFSSARNGRATFLTENFHKDFYLVPIKDIQRIFKRPKT
jgi:hypothetical protein